MHDVLSKFTCQIHGQVLVVQTQITFQQKFWNFFVSTAHQIDFVKTFSIRLTQKRSKGLLSSMG